MSNVKTSGMTLLEVIAIIAIATGVAFFLTPYFQRNHTCSRRTTCGQNMGQIHKAMTMYETDFLMYPTRAAEGKNPLLDGDAQEALNILYRNYVDDIRIFYCPPKYGHNSNMLKIAPSKAANWPGEKGTHFQEELPGTPIKYSTSYGYSPGHTSINSRVIILADHKGAGPKGTSDNHGKDAGQNVLSAGGSVSFEPLTISNDLGKDDAGILIVDPDIFSHNKLQGTMSVENKMQLQDLADWDSFCR